jgi:hypothetical protein
LTPDLTLYTIEIYWNSDELEDTSANGGFAYHETKMDKSEGKP